MKYCKKCLQPDTRPDIFFNEEQICGACLYEESKKNIDWQAREKEFQGIADQAKSEAGKRGVAYDCVIGVSGGKDSTFQALYAKEKLGLHPLLVNCMPNDITEAGRHNIDNLSSHGFDILHVRPDPVVAKKLAKKGFYEYGHIEKAAEYCLWASAFRMAIQFNVPLVIQGENPALTVGISNKLKTDDDAFDVFNINTLAGGSVDIWLGEGITEEMLYFYKAPSKEEYEAKNTRSVYLQYYVREWSQVGNADFAIVHGLRGRDRENLHEIGRYRRHTALDSDIVIANQMLKYLKFGFGFATDEACYDIREGRITREDAIWLVNEYDGKCGEKYIKYVCDYLGITVEDFWTAADRHVNKDLFRKDDVTGMWIPRFTVGQDFI